MSKAFSRRAALALFGASPAPVTSATVGASADPVFAAIERHKAAWAQFLPTVGPQENAPKGSAEDIAYFATCDAASEAFEAFMETVPTTLAGLRAALEYAVAVDFDCQPDNVGRIAATLLKSPVFAAI